jgi:cell cycle checkpoint control protein RAD9A
MDEFDHVEVQDKLHIIISVKDFRAILQHAQLTSGELTTVYSNPGRPMKLSYGADGVLCEFILMTVGEKDAMTQKHKNPRANAAKAARPELDAGSHRGSSVANDNHQAPPEPASAPPQQKTPVRPRQPAFEIRPQPMPPPATARSDSLFVGQADDDEQWEPVNPDEDEEEEENARLEWNATNEPVLLSLPALYLSSSLTKSGRTRRLCALAVIFPDRPRLKMRFQIASRRDLSQPSGCPRYGFLRSSCRL